MRIIVFRLLYSVLFINISLFPVPAIAENISIETMLETQEAGGDCGCYFYLAGKPEKESFVLYWPFHDESGVMKINGKLTYLDITDRELKYNLGEETSFLLKNNDTVVTGKCKVSWICPEDDESCEITKYTGKMSITRDKQTTDVAIQGSCGC